MPVWIVIGVACALFVLVIVIAASCNLFSGDAADESEPSRTLLPENFTAADCSHVSFRPALRGYRMDEVDQVVARLIERINDQNHVIESLQATSSADSVTPTKVTPDET